MGFAEELLRAAEGSPAPTPPGTPVAPASVNMERSEGRPLTHREKALEEQAAQALVEATFELGAPEPEREDLPEPVVLCYDTDHGRKPKQVHGVLIKGRPEEGARLKTYFQIFATRADAIKYANKMEKLDKKEDTLIELVHSDVEWTEMELGNAAD